MKLSSTLPATVLLVYLYAGSVLAQERSGPLPSADRDPFEGPVTREEAESEMKESLKVRKLRPGEFAIGEIGFNAKTREVTIPAVAEFPAAGDVIEYALVHVSGKTHETLFSTKASPQQIHTACLLLGIKPVGVPGLMSPTEELLLQGALEIDILWEQNDTTVRRSLSEFVELVPPSEEEPAKAIKKNPWLYHGSVFGPRGFAAQSTGSIITLIGDSTALMAKIGPDAFNDDIHFPNEELLLEPNAPVRVILRFPPPAAPSPSTPDTRHP